jgi:hypothetical protein
MMDVWVGTAHFIINISLFIPTDYSYSCDAMLCESRTRAGTKTSTSSAGTKACKDHASPHQGSVKKSTSCISPSVGLL